MDERLAGCFDPARGGPGAVDGERAVDGKAGLSVSTPDAHVAQCALDMAGVLLATDGVFRRIAGTSRLKLTP